MPPQKRLKIIEKAKILAHGSLKINDKKMRKSAENRNSHIPVFHNLIHFIVIFNAQLLQLKVEGQYIDVHLIFLICLQISSLSVPVQVILAQVTLYPLPIFHFCLLVCLFSFL